MWENRKTTTTCETQYCVPDTVRLAGREACLFEHVHTMCTRLDRIVGGMMICRLGWLKTLRWHHPVVTDIPEHVKTAAVSKVRKECGNVLRHVFSGQVGRQERARQLCRVVAFVVLAHNKAPLEWRGVQHHIGQSW